MRKNKNIFAIGQRKKIFRSKGFKQALSLIMVLFMCLVLLPVKPIEAVGGEYTIYFDASRNNGYNGWTKDAQIYIYAYDDTGNSGILPMNKSARCNSDGVPYWEKIFDREYKNVIFLVKDNWSDNDEAKQTVDILGINWAEYPCYYLDGGNSGAKKTCQYTALGPNTQAGKALKFIDMTENLGEITAVFGTDENFTDFKEVTKQDGKFVVPDDVNSVPYKYVKFKNGESYITDTYKVTSSVTDGTDININSGNSVLYYGATENSDGTKYSYWGKENTASSSINGKKLYLDKALFLSSKETKIQIGDGAEEKLNADSGDTATLSYTISNSTATQQTIITIITSDNIKYHFFWNDLSKNLVMISNNVAVVSGEYVKAYTVYFDATLSKLSYVGTEYGGDFGIPKAGSTTIKYHAWIEGGASKDGTLTKVENVKIGNNEWSDVYKADLDQKYEKILFYSGDIKSAKSDKTIDLTIPANLSSPCFYANSSDDAIYSSSVPNSLRSGYWNEVYTIRNPETEVDANNVSTGSDKEDKVVNVKEGNFEQERDTSAKYITTTFYDFYTDYELNGSNRDSYADVNIASHRIYQPFRQFDQALSDYYQDNNASSPLYWGNFQNYAGSKFTEIADTLNLFGYGTGDLYNKFFYENNSMWGRNGAEIKQSGKNATLKLVNNKLEKNTNNLLIKTSDGTVEAPYFDKDFLEGNNSKNTVLGKVYENVEFPFQSVALKSQSDKSADGTVDYWVFDSRGYVNDRDNSNNHITVPNTSLEMKKDTASNEYYLNSRDNNNIVKGQTVETGHPATADANFFPFNTSSESGKAAKLNYGFAMKMEFDFRLTENGTVTTTTGKEVPIEFNFSGDDDVWIFIDGQLALDIGGGHGRVEGRLNFKDKRYWISKTKNDSAGGGFSDNTTGAFSIEGENTSTHTLTMFYMERGLWESNMHVTFNFPDDNTLQVEKQIDSTDVNEIFQDTFTNNRDKLFTFNIKNKVTHYGKKDTDGNTSTTVDPVVFNDTLQNEKLKKGSNNNTFYHVDNFGGHSDVALWNAKLNDEKFGYVNDRFGIVSPMNGDTISIPEADRKFLKFDCYLQNDKNLSVKDFYVELEDSSGNKITGRLDPSKTKGISEVKVNQWQTITVELEKLQDITAYAKFDFQNVKYFKFECCYTKNIYLDNIKFSPEVQVNELVGFKTQQDQIPDYGSASEGSGLKNAVNAIYELKNNKINIPSTKYSIYESVDEYGNFRLGDREVATFSNQFRRGSYISISEEGVNPEVFETKWTIFENDQPVERFGNSDKVINPNPIPSLVDREDSFIENSPQSRDIPIDDGRTEIKDDKSGEAYYDGTRPEGNSIVFRSYKRPGDETSNVKLKALFVNKVRTGSIAIKKDKALDSPDLNGDYTFRVTFSNVAGMSLESDNIVQEFTLKLGETKEITGIPAGTKYHIEEIAASDNAKVENIEVKENNKGNDEYTVNSEDKTVTGVVKADDQTGATATTYSFANTTREKISIGLTKKWQDENGADIDNSDSSLPKFITVQLQRRIKNSNGEFTPVKVDGADYVKVEPNYVEGSIQWRYTFSNLDKYAEIKDGIETGEYEYRIVEVKVEADGTVTVPENNMITLNGKDYVINLGNPVSDDNAQYTITNKLICGSITINKVDEDDNPLNGAIFKLEKRAGLDTSTGQYVWETIKENVEASGGDSSNGTPAKCVFDNLEPGYYRITETKAPSGYNKLKEPIEVELPYTYETGTVVNGATVTAAGNTMDITFKIGNQKGSILPTMGGQGILKLLCVGFVFITIAGAIFACQKRQKKA